MKPDYTGYYACDHGQSAQEDLESSTYRKAYKSILKRLPDTHIADLLKETQKDTLGFTANEKSMIISEAAARLKKD